MNMNKHMANAQKSIANNISVKIANTKEDVLAAQKLRYEVFYEEYDAKPSPEMEKEKRDIDELDSYADHLIVTDTTDGQNKVVGTYRLLRQDIAKKYGSFYTSSEFNITPLTNLDHNLLELGRSCVLADYRTRPVLQLLWQGISEYMIEHEIGMLFGCASLHGTNIDDLSEELSYLYHYHMAPESWRPSALKERYVDMNLHPKDSIDPKKAFRKLPPLIRGYLRTGSLIGDGAVIDSQFGTTDVCIILPLEQLAPRYQKHYSRKINKDIKPPKSGKNDVDQDQDSVAHIS